MTDQPEQASGSHPVEATGETRGWGGGEVIRDHAGEATGETGWEGERIVRHQGEDEQPGVDTGWSGAEVVRDHGEAAEPDSAGGWSGSEVVKDRGESGTDPTG